MLGHLVEQSLEESPETGIQVYIGDETRVQSMKDCSVVTATYELGEGMRGTIGIIGPKRMDYEKVVQWIQTDLYRGRHRPDQCRQRRFAYSSFRRRKVENLPI